MTQRCITPFFERRHFIERAEILRGRARGVPQTIRRIKIAALMHPQFPLPQALEDAGYCIDSPNP